jgi:Tol biopolymer transport system component
MTVADGSTITNGPTKLTTSTDNDEQPAFSPDGRKIALTSSRDGGDFDVFKIKADGSAEVNLADTGVTESYPSWQPDP